MNHSKAMGKFKDLTSRVDDLTKFVTGVLNHFDTLKESGQRSEIEIGFEHWMNPEG